MPNDSNFALVIHAISNGLKFSQLEKNFLSMNLGVSFTNRKFRSIIKKASLALIELKNKACKKIFELANLRKILH